MEWLKGVHVIETYATTTLLVDDRLVLVDTSADADAGKVLDYLSNIRVKPKDLSTIFITHTHPDHVGNAAWLQRTTPGDRPPPYGAANRPAPPNGSQQNRSDRDKDRDRP